MQVLGLFAGLIAAYLLGSFPTGVIVGKLFFGTDPRKGGSGASGATNIFRQFGKTAGIVVSLIDVGKGALAAYLCSRLGSSLGSSAAAYASLDDQTFRLLLRIAGAFLAVLGHVYPVFAGFKGGKGVATGAGAIILIAPGAALFSALGFGIVLGTTGIVSASSMTAALILPIAVALGAAGRPVSAWLLGFAVLLALFVIFTHRTNVKRIARGEEKAFDKLKFLRRPKK
jgi:glycerol-3-phosphate acyltransferase PlsY